MALVPSVNPVGKAELLEEVASADQLAVAKFMAAIGVMLLVPFCKKKAMI